MVLQSGGQNPFQQRFCVFFVIKEHLEPATPGSGYTTEVARWVHMGDDDPSLQVAAFQSHGVDKKKQRFKVPGLSWKTPREKCLGLVLKGLMRMLTICVCQIWLNNMHAFFEFMGTRSNQPRAG